MYWLLWYFVDPEAFKEGGYDFYITLYDYMYCAILSFAIIAECKLWYLLFPNALVSKSKSLLISLLTIGSALVLSILLEKLSDGFEHYWTINDVKTVEGFFICSLISSIISIWYITQKFFRAYMHQVRESQLKEVLLLKRQLDPHFIFNNLGALDGLIDTNPHDAHVYIVKLSKVYRYMIKHTLSPSINLKKELEFLETYVGLLQYRFPNHFFMSINCNEEVLNKSFIIPLTLQSLIENVLKHNHHSLENPLKVEIIGSNNTLMVINSYNPYPQTQISSGFGLENIHRRYLLQFGKGIHWEIENKTFIVKIPIIYEVESTSC